jgi:hypothetical protein
MSLGSTVLPNSTLPWDLFGPGFGQGLVFTASP